MKRAAFFLVLAIVVGGVIASLMARDPGYVLLVYDGFSFETSLWFALLTLVVIYALSKLVFALLGRLANTGSGMRSWNAARRLRQAHEQTLRGVLLLAEGEWGAARAAFLGAISHAEIPLVNYLGAARAASALREPEARDSLLRHAIESTPGSSTAVRLVQVELQLAEGQLAEARAILEGLHGEAPRHALVLRRLVDCYRGLADWPALIALGPELRRNKAFREDEVSVWLRDALLAHFATADADALPALWESVPKKAREDVDLVLAYATALARSGGGEAAEDLVRHALKRGWDTRLVELYGRIDAPGLDRQLGTAESWLRDHPQDAALLLTLGRLALRQASLVKAGDYLRSSLRLDPTPAVYAELGRLWSAENQAQHIGD